MSYNKRVWLNKDDSPSTGSVVAFDDKMKDGTQCTFLSVSDCNNSIRLHTTPDDTIEDFIDKMKLLKSEIGLFIDYLEKQIKTSEV